jgi:hypothetical protein
MTNFLHQNLFIYSALAAQKKLKIKKQDSFINFYTYWQLDSYLKNIQSELGELLSCPM